MRTILFPADLPHIIKLLETNHLGIVADSLGVVPCSLHRYLKRHSTSAKTLRDAYCVRVMAQALFDKERPEVTAKTVKLGLAYFYIVRKKLRPAITGYTLKFLN